MSVELSNIKYSSLTGEELTSLVNSGVSLIGTVAASSAQKNATAAETGCGKRPTFTGKRRNQYNDCIADNKKRADEIAKLNAKSHAEDVRNQLEMARLQQRASASSDKKFLGMPQELGITLLVVGSAGTLFGLYKLAEFIKNRNLKHA